MVSDRELLELREEIACSAGALAAALAALVPAECVRVRVIGPSDELPIAAEWGYSTSAGVFAASAYGVATPAWCYATLFMGHSLAAGSRNFVSSWAFIDVRQLADADLPVIAGWRDAAAEQYLVEEDWLTGLLGPTEHPRTHVE